MTVSMYQDYFQLKENPFALTPDPRFLFLSHHHREALAHLLYGPPLQRGNCLVIEDLVPLYDVPLAVRVPETISRAYLVPGGADLPLAHRDGSVAVTVPVVQCHQAVVFAY